MGFQVCLGAGLACSFGLAPSSFVVLPKNRVVSSSLPAANIMDNIPLVNIPPFGMCSSLLNPTVASAMAAAAGVLTPMPCLPVIPGPWIPGVPQVLVGNMPAVNNSCTLLCVYGGVITVTAPGQTQTLD